MKFKTDISIPAFEFSIKHSDRILMMGSCFAENMAILLQEAGFQVDINPFGTIYNPCSLACVIRELLTCKKYTISDIFQYQGLYHSFSHHSRFSGTSPDECLEKINDRLTTSSGFLTQTSIFIITFGTSYVYNLKSSGQTVTNCHKLPDNEFQRNRLHINEIIDDWNQLIQEIRAKNPSIKLLFTVSPIRHWKDGAHENQLSKAILLLAIDELIRRNEHCYYFPSYELLLDDLRDYRFYAEDMLHPSTSAIKYIWEQFSEVFFKKETQESISEWQSIQKALNHKPFNPESEEYRTFLKKTTSRLQDFYSKHFAIQ